MAIDVIVPEIGEVGMQVVFACWLKGAGDVVRAGDILFTLDTDKAVVEVEAYADGTLVDLLVHDGDLVSPHQVVARILAPGESLQPRIVPAPPPVADERPSIEDVASSGRAEGLTADATVGAPAAGSSPRARRVAAEAGIDLAQVTGSGPDGLVSERDVRAAIAAHGESAATRPTGAAGSGDRAERTRQAVAELTSGSWRTIPHFYLALDADVTRALDHGRPTALVFLAVARALAQHPECNLAWRGDSVVQRETVDLGLLVDTPDGLLHTTIRNADQLSLAGMEAGVVAAVARARTGVLASGDLAPRSLTISNLGMYSVDGFSAVITPPDPLMLAVGRIRTEPRWDGAAWSPARVMPLTLSVDHRALAGAAAGRLLTTLEAILANADDALR